MMYFFYGTDASRAKKKINILVEALLKKRPDATHFYFDDRSFDPEFIKSVCSSVGLFTPHHVVVLDRTFPLFTNKALFDDMAQSEHVFVLFEDALVPDDKKFLEEKSEKTETFEHKQNKASVQKPNMFALTDAIGARDKKRAWVLYQELLGQGVDPEEVHPMIAWQAKTMLLVSESKNATEAGVKPFVFTKNKKSTTHFSKEELRDFSRNVVEVLYRARQGKNLSHEIERLLLSL